MPPRRAASRHPIHPALVHFPIACWTAVPVMDALYLLLQAPLWWRCAFWLLVVGGVSALAAMGTGLLELVALPDLHPGQRAALRHMLLMGSAWTVFMLDLLLRSPVALPSPTLAWTGLAVSTAGFAMLLAGAWTGAELVYRHGVGRLLPTDTGETRGGPE
jgi:uncharacterized membrane protein